MDCDGGVSSDKLNSAHEYGTGATMTLALPSRGAHLIVTGPALSRVAKFKTCRRARDWCATHYPCLSIHEAGAEIVKRRKRTKKFG